jgi:adenylosuccinate synthase
MLARVGKNKLCQSKIVVGYVGLCGVLMSKTTLIVGGYLGDEGKGKATQFFLEKNRAELYDTERGLCIRSTGGTNTGATVHFDDCSLGIHMLPVGAFLKRTDAYIGSGCYLNLGILLKELQMRRNQFKDMTDAGRVYISKNAHVVLNHHLQADKAKEDKQGFGSTKNGVSVAAACKYSYTGVRLGDLVDNKFAKGQGVIPFQYSVDTFPLHKSDLDDVQVQITELLTQAEVVDPYIYFSKYMKGTHRRIVVEGTQGVGLDVNHGFDYPYVSAGSFGTLGLLDGIGYFLNPNKVVMVLKSYGTYFGNQDIPGKFEDNDFIEFAGEYGTTTKRPRKLCWMDTDLLRRMASLIKPTCIMVNRMDTLNWFAKNNKEWKLIVEGEKELAFTDRAVIDNGRLTNQANMFLETIEETCGAPVKYVGTGPQSSDIIKRDAFVRA